MTRNRDVLVQRIEKSLRLISANELQVLAEDMAIISCPHRFGSSPLNRGGRNTQAQTTKGWPDAYVFTGPDTVDGIEATRDQQSWAKHLAADLSKAQNPDHFKLSGYFFVAGYPDAEPSKDELTAWVKKFAALGINEKNIQILVGRHLALELADPKYARARQQHLGITSSPVYFEELIAGQLGFEELDEIRPSVDDFLNHRVFVPQIAESVIKDLLTRQIALVRGHGACGKTTLAQVVSVDERLSRSPFFYLDIASEEGAVSAGAIKNELVELSGYGVVFVIDNLHLNEQLAMSLYTHWERYCKAGDAKILLLGRETRSATGSPLGALASRVLRAGVLEMRGVLARLFARRGQTPPQFARKDEQAWLETFGGMHSGTHKAVDLIAFSAAVQRRASYLLKGDPRLDESDAIGAIDERYLRKLRSTQELANLLTLASLAGYELPIPRTALPYPDVGLSQASNELGIVFVTTPSGQGGAYRFSLAHPALGRLILAARTSIDAKTERAEAVKRTPHLGFRLLTRSAHPDEREALHAALRISMANNAWVEVCAAPHDVIGVMSGAIRFKICARDRLDEIAGCDAFSQLLRSTRNLNTLTAIAGWARSLHLPGIAAAVYDTSAAGSEDSIRRALISSSSGDVLAFLKNADDPRKILRLIDTEAWEPTRMRIPPDIASTTSQLIRFFEREDAFNLAHAPALAFIQEPISALFENSDLGDVSNIVRASNASIGALKSFFKWLKDSGRLDAYYGQTQSGQLCGSLMSFSNYLADELRPNLLLDSLRTRVELEITNGLNGDSRALARSVCLIGASFALFGESALSNGFRWPNRLDPGEVFASRAATSKQSQDSMGMYELQFWLGLWALALANRQPPSISGSVGNSALSKLGRTDAPTALGLRTRRDLLAWMSQCRNNGWSLVSG